MVKYLSELLGRRVREPDGRIVGTVRDMAARQGGRLPVVTGVLVRGRASEWWISIADLRTEDGELALTAPVSQLEPHIPSDKDLLLQRDILDKQIVDVQDYRVVRASDVRLAACADGQCVVGVDASLRAILRRAGLAAPIEALARLIGKPLHASLIAWDDVETLEASGAGGGRIKLKVPHEKIARLHPADIADIVEQLNPQQRTDVIDALDVQTAADTIEEMEDEEAAEVMDQLEDEKAADILEEMEPDEAADVLGDLSEVRSAELLGHMEPDDAADVKELLAYEEETAGGLMTTEYIAVGAAMTAQEAIEHLRALAPEAQSIYYVYVVDDEGRLSGVISLRDLIVAEPDHPVGAFMVSSVRHVAAHEHGDELARVFSRYNLLALPVTDDEGKLLGIVTVDDMMEWVLPPERRRKVPVLSIEE